jgi:ParB/RepB/Spo0J family partition protein
MAERRRNPNALLDALDASTDEQEVSTVPLRALHPNPQQPRQHGDPERFAELVASVQEYGVLQPLLVRPRPAGGYEIIAGERRYRAATAARLPVVPVVIRDADDETARYLSLVENLLREDLDIEDEAVYLRALRDAGLSLRAIAGAIHKHPNYVRRRILLLETPGALAAYRAGVLNLNQLLAAAPPDPTPLALLPDEQAGSATYRDLSPQAGPGVYPRDTPAANQPLSAGGAGVYPRDTPGGGRPPTAASAGGGGAFRRPVAPLKLWQRAEVAATIVDPAAVPPAERATYAAALDALISALTTLRQQLGE